MNEELIYTFRKRIQEHPVFGSFMKAADAAFVEIAGYAGMDFTILDREHGPNSLESLQNHIRAAQVAGVLPVVRVPSLDPVAISQSLDIGAAGVQVPQITTAEQAETAVRAAKYYPGGERGVCRFVRSARYSAHERESYFRQANADTLVILQLEGQEAIQNLDAILDVKGVDVIFIGPYDLSQSLGLPGQITHPKVIANVADIVEKALSAGVITGVFTDTQESMKMWMDAGVRYISYSVDVGIYYEACSELVRTFRDML